MPNDSPRRIDSRESSSICLPNPLSCTSLTEPYRLKRFHGLSPNSKPVSSQGQEDDRREAGRSTKLSPQDSACMAMAATRCPSKETMCLLHTDGSFAYHACFSLSVFPSVPSFWLGSGRCSACGPSPSNLFGPILHLLVEQLVMPAQIVSDRGHALIAHQFL